MSGLLKLFYENCVRMCVCVCVCVCACTYIYVLTDSIIQVGIHNGDVTTVNPLYALGLILEFTLNVSYSLLD